METKFAVFDLNGVLTDKTLAVELIKHTKYKKEAIELFKSYKNGLIGDRKIVIEGSKLFKGLSYKIVQQEAQNINPRIRSLDLPGWETVILSLDYIEVVRKIANDLGVPRYYGNITIYEDGIHSGIVKEPIIDSEQKKIIVSGLKKELKTDISVGIDDGLPSPFEDVCDKFFQVSNKEELENALTEIRKI